MKNFYKCLFLFILSFCASPLLAQGQDCNCKYTVDASMTYMDAALSWPDLGPGDTLCVQAGVRNRLFIKNIQGAPGKPVTIINCGGQVIFDNTTSSEGAFSVVASQYFRISGTGSPQHRYGFFLRTNKKGSSMHLSYSDYELDHVEIGDAGFAGVMSKIDPHCNNPEYWRGNFVMQNISIHDNYIHHTHGEGLYIGNTSFAGKQTSECGTLLPHELHHVRIYNNRIEDTGADGLQLSCATQDVEVYNNHIERFGTDPFAPHQNQGLIIGGGSSGKYYNNRIINGTGSGISCFGLGRIELFNNLIYRPDGYGIFVDERSDMPKGSGYLVAHNTIVEPGLDGFRIYSLNAENSRLANNIIAQPNRLPKENISYSFISIRNGVEIQIETNLFTDEAEQVGFLDWENLNFKLLEKSAAVDQATFIEQIDFDIDQTGRPYNNASDIGAFEFTREDLMQPTGLEYDLNGNGLHLSWKDNSEGESSFIVQRSKNQDFSDNTEVVLGANTTLHTENNPQYWGGFYYRVFAADKNERSAPTNTVLVYKPATQPQIHPNPVVGTPYLKVPSSFIENPSVYKVYDPQGKMITTGFISTTSQALPIGDQPQGVYVVEVHNSLERSLIKLIKQ